MKNFVAQLRLLADCGRTPIAITCCFSWLAVVGISSLDADEWSPETSRRGQLHSILQAPEFRQPPQQPQPPEEIETPPMQRLPGSFTPLSQLRVDPRPPVEPRPDDRSDELLESPTFYAVPPTMMPWVFMWRSPEIRYHQLYFEHVPLERYGQTRRPLVQPGISAIHFYGSLAALPYLMAVDRPWMFDSPLGYCRPGQLAPWTRARLPRWHE